MTLWEYRIEYPTLDSSDSEMTAAWLDELGASGWELVTLALGGSLADGPTTLVFKRPKL